MQLELCACAHAAQVAIASHFGRPQPRKQTWAEMQASHSLGVVAATLSARLGEERFTGLAPDCIGPLAKAKVDALEPGQVGRLLVFSSTVCLCDIHVISMCYPCGIHVISM